MLICVMRHGDAEAFSTDGKDASRLLTDRGHADNLQLAQQLKARVTSFDLVCVSPYRRAQQTADDVLSLYPGCARQTVPWLVPEFSAQESMDALDSTVAAVSGQGDSMLLIGHNPLVSRLLMLLNDGAVDSGGNGVVPRYLATSELIAVVTQVIAPACGQEKFSLTASL